MQLTKKERLPSRARSSGRGTALRRALPQGPGRKQRLKLTLDAAELLADHRVVDPAGIAIIAPSADQTRRAERLQVVGDQILGQAQLLGQFTVAGLTLHQQQKDPPPGRIGQQLEKD